MTSDRRRCRATLLVLLDPAGADEPARAAARQHAATCPDCAAVLDDPDAATAALDAVAAARPGPHRVLRRVLAVVAAAQVLVALPWLFGADPTRAAGATVPAHLTRDGAIGVAVGVAGLIAALRPAHARVVAGLCAAPLVAQVVSGVADGFAERVHDGFEALHLAVAAIVVLALFVGRPRRGPRAERRRPVPLQPLR